MNLVAILIWIAVLVEWAVVGRYVYRQERRRREQGRAWRNSAHAIPYRDLRREYLGAAAAADIHKGGTAAKGGA